MEEKELPENLPNDAGTKGGGGWIRKLVQLY